MNDPLHDVRAAEGRIRDLVNSPRRSHLLRQNMTQWLQVCSAMDAIGDTQFAVEAFLQEPPCKRGTGRAYLLVYGVLQALYVQSDAARTLAKSFGLVFNWPPELKSVRVARNLSIGHPTDYDRGSGSAMISRMSVGNDGFSMFVDIGKGKRVPKAVDLPSAIRLQSGSIVQLLNQCAVHLMTEELDHRRKFRGQPLRQSLPETLAYMAEKIAGALRDESLRPEGLGAVNSIRSALAALQNQVAERGLTEVCKDSLGRAVADLEFVLDRFAARLQGGMIEWVHQDEDVYWWFLVHHLKDLRKQVEEIDAEYNSDEV